jgi:hypothetical protein
MRTFVDRRQKQQSLQLRSLDGTARITGCVADTNSHIALENLKQQLLRHQRMQRWSLITAGAPGSTRSGLANTAEPGSHKLKQSTADRVLGAGGAAAWAMSVIAL